MGNTKSTQPPKPRKDRKKEQADGKTPKEPVTVIARAAGKLWTKMSPEQRKKYIDLANAEKKRRQGKRKLRLRKRR